MRTAPNTHKLKISWANRIADIDRREWDRLALPLKSPFLEWEWLNLMETSGSIAPETGWTPRHLTVWRGPRLAAAAALYIKSHSEGEYIYDYAWADVAMRIGVEYYPKMIGMSPVTPVTGYRFLVDPEMDEVGITAFMLGEIDRHCIENGLAACNFLFAEPEWKILLERMGRHGWAHQSFIWLNRGFESFEDYLALFKTNQRRNIRRERKAMEKQGLALKTYHGGALREDLFSCMHDFYSRTNDKFGPWGCKYLTKDFFTGLPGIDPGRLLMVAAFEKSDKNAPAAMSLLVTKKDRLYGRYWGCRRQYDSLHFNACYYTPIEWAIEHGVQTYNPGAGGAHKVRRGFVSVPSYSLLKFYDHRLHTVMARNIARINRMEFKEIDAINRGLPFADHGDPRRH